MNTSPLRIAVKSPEYLPGLSFVALMQAVDVFVLADTFQYSRQSFQNRTRIRTPQGWHWISVPLAGRQHGRPVVETEIDNRTHWQSKHLRSIGFNYSQTAYYPFIEEEMKRLFDNRWELLGDLTCQSVSIVHEIFQMKCRLLRASSLDGCPDSLEKILEVIPATELLTDGMWPDLQDIEVPVGVVHFTEPAYRQHFEGFEPGISALDIVCNYGPEASGIIAGGVIR
ncbi:MAG: WbqC family protein [Rhodothermales bacterium]